MIEEPVDHVARNGELLGEFRCARATARAGRARDRSAPGRGPARQARPWSRAGDGREPAARAVAGNRDALSIEAERCRLARQPGQARRRCPRPRRGRGARARADSRARTRSRRVSWHSARQKMSWVSISPITQPPPCMKRMAASCLAPALRRRRICAKRIGPAGPGTARSLASPISGGSDLRLGERAAIFVARGLRRERSRAAWRSRTTTNRSAPRFRGRASRRFSPGLSCPSSRTARF